MKAIDAIMPRPITPEQAAQLQRDFNRAIEPILKIKVDVHSCATTIMRTDGKGFFEAEHQFTDAQQQQLQQCDQLIEEIRQAMSTPKPLM